MVIFQNMDVDAQNEVLQTLHQPIYHAETDPKRCHIIVPCTTPRFDLL